MTLLNQSSLSEILQPTSNTAWHEKMILLCCIETSQTDQSIPCVFPIWDTHQFAGKYYWGKIMSVFISIHISQTYPEIAFYFVNWFLHFQDFCTPLFCKNRENIRKTNCSLRFKISFSSFLIRSNVNHVNFPFGICIFVSNANKDV